MAIAPRDIAMADVKDLSARLKMPTNESTPGGDSKWAPYHADVRKAQPQEILNAFSEPQERAIFTATVRLQPVQQ